MNTATQTKRKCRLLGIELAAILCVKVLAITLIWALWFSHPFSKQYIDQSMAQHLLYGNLQSEQVSSNKLYS